MAKSLFASIAVLAILLAVYFIWKPTTYTSTTSGEPSGAVQAFRATKFDDVSKIEIQKGKGSVVLEKDPSQAAGWVVASSHRYPADKDKVEKILKSLREIEKIEQRGSSEAAHASYEVDAKKGALVTLHGKDKELGRLVVGKSAPGGGFSSNLVFARFGDDKKTYSIESGIRNEASLWSENAEGKNYLLKDLLKLPEDTEVDSVRITRPDKPDILVERRSREVLVEKPKDPAAPPADAAGDPAKPEEDKKEEKKEEKKTEEYYVVTSGTDTFEVGKSEEWTARGILNRAKTISIDDAAEPKDLAEYGLDKPQVRAAVAYRKKGSPDAEVKTFSLAFGNAKKNEKGDTQGYYFILEDDATKGRIYVIQEYKLNEWNKELKDFQPKPKEPEKPKDAPPAVPPAPPQPPAEAAPPPAAEPDPGAATPPQGAPATAPPPGASTPPGETQPATPPQTSAAPPGGATSPPPAPSVPPAEKK